ncbi:unnamed protein product [Jaminaea pallidilutea]
MFKPGTMIDGHRRLSGSTSNLINNKTDTPEFKSVADFVQRSRSEAGAVEFTLDGNRGEKKSQLCRILPRDAAAAAAGTGGAGGAGGVQKSADGRLLQCTEIAMEAKDLFGTMQMLNFFCQLPQDPNKTHISCQPIPK